MRKIHRLFQSEAAVFYNMIFPLFFILYLLPNWLYFLLLVINLAIDSAIFLLCVKKSGISLPGKKKAALIAKAWGCGFLADVLASIAAVAFSMSPIFEAFSADWQYALFYSPWQYPVPLLLTIGFVVLGGALVFLLDRYVAFRKAPLEASEKTRIALWMAICTAPYLFLIPTEWFFIY